ncbi:Spy/CpxP family protein refolding chaperone [Sorangium sp. So ce1000]|uniref:Spy/CpxP family protein refolding chaperone n=1 Tax=Sorangium sp. So ce1000 TaxID=3133325 RepID=UPI003F5DFF03
MMQSRWWRLGGILPLVGALVGAGGCTAETGQGDTSPSNEAAEAALAAGPSKAGGRREGFGGHRGPEHLLLAALHELDLSDAQKATIQGALEGLRDGAPGERPKAGAAFAALAEGVRAGKIDRAAIEAKLPDASRAAEEHRARVAGALNTLHATLTKEQRRQLVDAIAAKMDEREERGERGPRGDDHHRGPRSNRGAMGDPGMRGPGMGAGGPSMRGPGMRGPGMRGPGMRGGPLGHLLAGLDLRDEQRAQIDKVLESTRPSDAGQDARKEDHAAKRAEMRARLETFAADRFDANAFLPQPPAGEKMGPRAHLGHMVDALAAIVPILDEAQRNALADRIEKGPAAGRPERGERGFEPGGRGFGPGGRGPERGPGPGGRGPERR